jgi:hypothetical protein
MKLRPVAVGAVLITVALCGCGGSSSSSSSSTAKATTAATETGSGAVALPPRTPAALRGVHGGVLRAGDLTGYVPQGYSPPATSAQSWVAEFPPAQRAPEAARLKATGFVAGISEHLAPTSGGGEAISVVEQFRSGAAATGEVSAQLNQALGRHESAFAVTDIPGARAWGIGKPTPDANVAFAVGPYYYLVGFGSSGVGAPTHAQLVTAAQRLYSRVRG